MNLAASAPSWLLLILGALLLAAAAEDAWRLRISNITSGAVLLAGILAVAIAGPQLILWQNVVVLCAILAVGTALFTAGHFGGGDVKLFAAVGFWFSLKSSLILISAIFLAGGALALIVLGLRLLPRKTSKTSRKKNQVPYGVAIAAGAAFAFFIVIQQSPERAIMDFSPDAMKRLTRP
ncbi:MAG: prepilin peptidase [Sphingomicrobium sp.]